MKPSLGESLNLFSQTLPFFFIRALLLMCFGVLALVSVFLLFFFLHTANARDPFFNIILLTICIGISGSLVRFFQRHLLFIYKMAHVAYASRWISLPRSIPDGASQIQTGKNLVRGKCINPSTLYAIRQYLHQVLKNVFTSQKQITSPEKIPEMNASWGFSRIWAAPGLPYLKEAMLGFAFNRDDQRFSASLKKTVAIVQANRAQWLRAVCRTGQIDMAGYGVFFLLAFLPGALLFRHFSLSLWGAALLALIQGFILKQIFLFPILQMNMIQHFEKSDPSIPATFIFPVSMSSDTDMVDIDN